MSKNHRKSKNITASKKVEVILPSLVDIVMPNRGRFDLLARCLDAIPSAAKDISYNVWICDNGSPKGEAEKFYAEYIRDRRIHPTIFPDPKGYPLACNFAAKQGKSPLILILTNDVFLHEGSLDKLVREMDDPKNGLVGMKLLFPPESPHGPAEKVQHVGLSVNIRAEVQHQFIGWRADHPKVLAMRDCFAVTGAVFMTRRNIWKNIRGFYLGYGLGTYEDVNFAVNVRNLGYNVICSQATAYHMVNATASAYGFTYPLNENKQLFMSRCSKDLQWDEYLYW